MIAWIFLIPILIWVGHWWYTSERQWQKDLQQMQDENSRMLREAEELRKELNDD